jgi:hypothetical protein
VLLQPGKYLRNVVSRVDDHGVVAVLVAQDGAVAAQRADGKNFKDHAFILGEIAASVRRLITMQAMRIYAAAGASLGWSALTLQLYLMLVKVPAGGMLAEAITFVSFFTILTNLLVALVLTAVAIGKGEVLRSPSTQAATVVYISVVGVVYHLLLRKLWNPQGAQLAADLMLHTAMPLVYIAYWLLFATRTGLRWKDAVIWLSYPLGYLVYTLARGAVAGVYPYPFVDVNLLGYGRVMAHAGVFLVVFLGLGLLVVALGRAWRGRSLA